MPRACSRKLVGAGPHISAARTIISAGTPAIFAAYSGVYFFTPPRPARSRWCAAAMKSRSIQPRSIMTCSIPLKTPMSPPGRTGMKRSALRAIGVMRGIEHDELAAVLARLPQVVGGDGRALGDVGARDQDDLGLRDVAPGIGAAVNAKDLLRRRAGRDHAEPPVVVDVGGAQRHSRELAHQVGLLVGERRAGQHREGVAAVSLLNALHLADHAVERRVPADGLEALALRRAASGCISRSGCSSCM